MPTPGILLSLEKLPDIRRIKSSPLVLYESTQAVFPLIYRWKSAPLFVTPVPFQRATFIVVRFFKQSWLGSSF